MNVVESMVWREVYGDKIFNYCFKLIKEEIVVNEEKDLVKVQSYGIEVERQDTIDGVIVNVVKDSIKSISPHRYKVHNLLKLLYDNCVSPIHLVDVIGEYVDEYISDFDEYYKNTAVLD